MKISKDTYLVVLSKEEAKALALFVGSTSKADAVDMYKKYDPKGSLAFTKLLDETDVLFKAYKQVEDAK